MEMSDITKHRLKAIYQLIQLQHIAIMNSFGEIQITKFIM